MDTNSPLPVFKNHHFTKILNRSNVTYGFYGRRGGYSGGVYQSLNCGIGSGDDSDTVLKNWALIAQNLGAPTGHLYGPYQCHSNKCIKLDNVNGTKDKPHADAYVTNLENIPIAVLTADCVPVLFFAENEHGSIVGAAHSGWRGAVSGVLDNTIKALCSYSDIVPENIYACIGPHITVNSYEVDDAFRNERIKECQDNKEFFIASDKKDKFYFDLSMYCKNRLINLGVQNIYDLELDTYSNPTDFFSFRRSTHDMSANQGYGRQISAIMIKG